MRYFSIFLVVFVVIFIPLVLGAQITFERFYGDSGWDSGQSVIQTTDKGYAIVGTTWPFGAGEYDIYLVRTDSLGDTLWTKTFGGNQKDYGKSIQQTFDKGFIIAGITYSFGSGGSDVYFIKTDSLGDTIWTKAYGEANNEDGNSCFQTSDKGYIILGTTNFGASNFDFYLIKTDSLGDTVWTKTFGGNDGEMGYFVNSTLDGGFILTGTTTSYGSGASDVYLIKTDPNGSVEWSKAYGGLDYDRGFSVIQTSDRGYVVAGYTWSFGAGNADVYLIKTDSLGDTLWTGIYGGNSNDEGYSVIQTSDAGYAVIGYTYSFGEGRADAYLIRTDSVGDTLWTKTHGDTLYDLVYSAAQTSDGGYILGGYTSSYGAKLTDFYLVKTDSLGNVGVQEQTDSKPVTRNMRLTVSPNPFVTVTSIELLGATKNTRATLTIYDSAGRLVKSIKLETSTYQLGADLKAGIYFLKLNGKPVGKVVKVR